MLSLNTGLLMNSVPMIYRFHSRWDFEISKPKNWFFLSSPDSLILVPKNENENKREKKQVKVDLYFHQLNFKLLTGASQVYVLLK